MTGRGGLTLVEVLVAATLAAALAALALGTFVTLQQATARATVAEATRTTARTVAVRLADALRDLNVDDLDLEPDAPVAFVPSRARPLRFRTLVGYDPAQRRALLSPPRAGDAFAELTLEGGVVALRRAGLAVTLGEGVTELSLTLDRATDPPTLWIEVVADRRDAVEPGRTVRCAARLRVALRNAVPEAQ